MRRRDFLTGAAASSMLLPSAAEAMLGSRRAALLGTASYPLIVNQGLLSNATFQAAIAGAKAGTQRPFLVEGDSIPSGYGSSSVSTRYRYSGFPVRFASLLAAGGVKASAQGFFSNGNLHSTGSAVQYDDRVTINTDYSQGVQSLGGKFMFANNAAASWTFTPKDTAGNAINCDSFDIYYYTFSGGGTLSYSIDGGAATNFSTNVSPFQSLKKLSVTGLSLATHTITIAWVSGQAYFVGLDAFDSTATGFKFINGAINGGVLQDFTPNTNGYDAMKVATTLAPVLALICIGANAWNAGEAISTFRTNLQTLATEFSSVCPLILISDIPSNPSTKAALSTQKLYVDEMIACARTNGLLMFNEWQAFGGLSANFDSRWFDAIHASATGAQQMAQDMATPFLAVA